MNERSRRNSPTDKFLSLGDAHLLYDVRTMHGEWEESEIRIAVDQSPTGRFRIYDRDELIHRGSKLELSDAGWKHKARSWAEGYAAAKEEYDG